MVDLFYQLKSVMAFAWDILSMPIYLANDFYITLKEVLLFILLGSILYRLVAGLYEE